jgi:crotonobetainyl-CoA:carnitine CoA-transferase CaiB-like acyl-CoA transferase
VALFSRVHARSESKTFQSLNRGKKSLVLKLAGAEGAGDRPPARAPRWMWSSCNYRPDVPKKLGIDYETLSALNPSLIYADNTAWGRKGPWSHRPGYDIIVQAVSGVMASGGQD